MNSERTRGEHRAVSPRPCSGEAGVVFRHLGRLDVFATEVKIKLFLIGRRSIGFLPVPFPKPKDPKIRFSHVAAAFRQLVSSAIRNLAFLVQLCATDMFLWEKPSPLQLKRRRKFFTWRRAAVCQRKIYEIFPQSSFRAPGFANHGRTIQRLVVA